MTIVLASDHAGFKLKERIGAWLGKRFGVSIIDMGPDAYEPADDYPVYGHQAARAVLDTKDSIGIFICGSGVGMSIVANRHAHIRAALAESVETARRARSEDHANVLVLGSRVVSFEKAKKIISAFLQTRASSATRHKRRIAHIETKKL